MNTERYARVKRILEEAVELPFEERRVYVVNVSEGDVELQREVFELLSYHDDPRAFLRPEDAAEVETDIDPLPERIGGHRILRKLGEGGMGTVYEAEQDSPRRRVAVKVVRAGLGSSEGRNRFALEAEVLGRLRHHGIAQIFEAGSEDRGHGPQPYLVMELVEGEPLGSYAKRMELDLDARLELVERIADAVEHAHRRGIIHRDLKSSNILVEPGGRPKVLDFGIARVLESDAERTPQLTLTGQVIGTLATMSPEQVQGRAADLDTRTDVYALGVITYELLAGRLPIEFDDVPLPEAMRRIVESEPTPLARLRPDVPRDVVTIVHKALSKDRERRYSSAAALAEDLRHFRNDEPITARPASRIYQLRKFAKRNRALVAGMVATFVALVAGMISTSLQAARASRSAELAERRLEDVQRANDESVAVRNFLQRIVRSASPQQLGREATILAALEEAERELEGAFADSPRVEAAVRLTMGATWNQLGEHERSIAHLRRALRLRRENDSDDEHLRAPIHYELGQALSFLGRFEEAEFHVERAVHLFREGGDDLRTIATFLLPVARLAYRKGDFERANPLYERAIALYRESDGESRALAIALNNHGEMLRQQGDSRAAEARIRNALDMMETLGLEDSADRGRMLHNLANVMREEGRFEEAVPLRRHAVGLARRHLPDRHVDLAVLVNTLAKDLSEIGKEEEAHRLAEEALTLRRGSLPETHPHVLDSLNTLAELYRRQGDLEAAATALDEAEALVPRCGLEPTHFLVLSHRRERLHWLRERGEETKAIELARAIVNRADERNAGDWRRGVHERDLGETLAEFGRKEEAETWLRRSLTTLRESLGPEHFRTRRSAAALREALNLEDRAREDLPG